MQHLAFSMIIPKRKKSIKTIKESVFKLNHLFKYDDKNLNYY